MEIEVTFRGENYKLLVEKGDGGYHLRIGDRSFEVSGEMLKPTLLRLVINGKNYDVYHVWDKDWLHLSINGKTYTIKEAEHQRASAAIKDNTLLAPMTGAVVKVNNKEGDIVEAGATIMIVEAMKMENELKAHHRAKIKKINGKVGDQVEGGKVLVELELLDG